VDISPPNTESARHRVLLERAEGLAGIGHYRDDLRTNELFWSSGLYDIVGIDAANANLVDVADLLTPLVGPAEVDRLIALRDAAAQVGRSYTYELTLRRPDGKACTIVNLAVPEFDEDGRVCAYIGIVRDITEMRRREKKMRDLTAQYEHAERLAGICHTYHDFATNTLVASPTFFTLLGAEPTEDPIPFDDLARTYFDPDEIVASRDRRAKIRATGEAFAFELNIRHAGDGELRTLMVDCEPDWGPDGEVIGQFAIVRDVTDERRAAHKLKKSNQLLERAQRMGQVGHCYDDYIADTLTASDTFFAIYGFSPQGPELSFDSFTRAVFDDANHATAKELREAAKHDKKFTSMETWFTRATDGELRYVHVESEPDFDAEGRLIGNFGIVRDVTDERRTERELRRSNWLLERAQRLSGTGHAYDDYTTETLYGSDMFFEIFGLEQPDCDYSYTDWLRAVWGDDAVEANLKGREDAVRDRKGVLHDSTFIHPEDGERHYVRLQTEPDFDTNGNVIGSFCIVQDITDLRRASHDLEHTNRLFDRAQNLAHVGHGYYDIAKDSIDASTTFFEIIGVEPWTQAPPLNEFVRLIFSEDAATAAAAEIGKASLSDAPARHEMVIRRVDTREKRYIQLVVEQRRDRNEKVIGQFWIIQDVTHLRQTERSLREREMFLIKAQQAAHVAPFRYDLVRRVITDARVMREFYGWPDDWPSEIPPEDIFDRLVDPDQAPKITATREAATVAKTSFVTEFAIRRMGNEEIRHLRIYADPELGPNGDVVAYFGIMQDVTQEVVARQERRDLRSQIERAQRVETLGFFAGGLAHEISNVIQPLPFLSRQLADAFEANKEDEARRTLDALRIAGDRALGAVRDMLDYIGSEREAGPANRFGDVLDVTARFLSAALRARTTFEASPEATGSWVAFGRTGFLQIILNLAQNAIEAGGDSVTISLKAERQVLGEDEAKALSLASGDYLRITVHDDGPGMEPDVMARIFEPFFSTRERERGSGLGLALVRNMVARWGGAITVGSTPGQGACFTILAPCAEPPIEK